MPGIPGGMTLRPRCYRWDAATSTWIAKRKVGSQSGLSVSPRRKRWDPTCIGKIPLSQPGIPPKSWAAYLPSYNIIENPMQSTVRDHDAFSNDKPWKEIQICHVKFVLLIITNMFIVNAMCRDTMIGIMTLVVYQWYSLNYLSQKSRKLRCLCGKDSVGIKTLSFYHLWAWKLS